MNNHKDDDVVTQKQQLLQQNEINIDDSCPSCKVPLSRHSNNELVTCAINELDASIRSSDLRGIKNE